MLSPNKNKGSMKESRATLRAIFASFVMVAVFAMAFCIGATAATGLDGELVAGITGMQVLVVCVIVIVIGVVALAMTDAESMAGWLTIIIPAIVAFIVIASSLSAPPTGGQASVNPTWHVTNLAVTHGNASSDYSLTTAIVRINKTTPTMGAPSQHITLNFTVLRNDAAPTTDIQSLTFSYAPTSVTSATTGSTYSYARTNSDGRPDVNWTVTSSSGVTVSTRTLSGTTGMTSFESIHVAINIDYNYNAFGVSQRAANDVIPLGTVTIGTETFGIQAIAPNVST